MAPSKIVIKSPQAATFSNAPLDLIPRLGARYTIPIHRNKYLVIRIKVYTLNFFCDCRLDHSFKKKNPCCIQRKTGCYKHNRLRLRGLLFG